MKDTRHLGVYGIIIENNKILLVKKSRGAYIGKLDLPGGSIEHGETPIETLKRELKEETNCEVSAAKLIDANSVVVDWTNDEVNEHMHHICIIYEVLVSNHDIKGDSDGLDSLGAEWYDISKLTKDNLSEIAIFELEKLGYILN